MNRKLIGLAIIFMVLLVVPFFYRQLLYGSGNYVAPVIATVDSKQIKSQLSEYNSFTDQPTGSQGRVIIDLSHNNNIESKQLAPLQNRLTVRGVTVDFFTGNASKLKKTLRSATALLILAPTTPYEAEERELISKFVLDGGQLILGADPVLPLESNQGMVEFLASLFPNSGYPAINSLAAEFDLIYFNDYLYNLENNAGNYRHVEFTKLDRQNPLTKGLDKLVFFVSHSLHSEGVALIGGNENTLSSLRPGQTNLMAGSLSADGKVLALGDVTFLTPPYYTMADNDQFISRLANWLAVDKRERTIEDFPYIFTRSVDLIQINDGVIDDNLITQMRKVQEAFKRSNVLINLRDKPNGKNDVLYVGSFDDVELVQDLLLTAGVTIDNGNGSNQNQKKEKPKIDNTSPITPTETIRGGISRSNVVINNSPSDDDEDSAKEDQEGTDTIEIEGLGVINVEGTTVFVMDDSNQESFTLITLGENVETALKALQQLNTGDLSNCILAESVTVCTQANRNIAANENENEDEDEEREVAEEATEESELESGADSNGAAGDIFILANDDGAKGSRTNVDELQNALSTDYDIKVWSIKEQGVPTAADVKGYKMYIIDGATTWVIPSVRSGGHSYGESA